MWELKPDGTIEAAKWSPLETFGCSPAPLESVRGGDGQENAALFQRLLQNKLTEHDPVLTFTLLNAAALLYVSSKASSPKEGFQLAREAIRSGSAWKSLEAYRKVLIQ